jgi:hypothetical protein
MLNITHLPALPLRRGRPLITQTTVRLAAFGMLHASLALTLSGVASDRETTKVSTPQATIIAPADQPAYRWLRYYRTSTPVPTVRDGKAITRIDFDSEGKAYPAVSQRSTR